MKIHRVQLDFSQPAYDDLQAIKQRAGDASKAKTIENALKLYEWLLNIEQRGAGLVVVETDGSREEIELLF